MHGNGRSTTVKRLGSRLDPSPASSVSDTKDTQGRADKGPHTLGFPGSFFEGGGNQM